MLLCDIGNSTYHFFDDSSEYKKSVNTFDPSTVKEKVFYISVNIYVNEKLRLYDNWIDLSFYISLEKYYKTIGIDRAVACEMIENGIVIDAGSAITLDIVEDNDYKGGFIYPGIHMMMQTYKNISPALDYSFNFELDLDKMPKNSRDAISYGYLKLLHYEVLSRNLNVILTGGDAEKFITIFPDAQIDKLLLFKGMKKIIQKANLC